MNPSIITASSEKRSNDNVNNTAHTKTIIVEWHKAYEASIYNNTAIYSKSLLLNNFVYYPGLSVTILIPTLISITLLALYFIQGIVTINPIVLIWAITAFGGIYIVLISAAKEIVDEQNKYL